MKFRLTMDSAILGIKYAVSLCACWPLPPDAKPSDVRRHNLWWWLIFLNLTTNSTALVYNMYLHLDNPLVAIRIATEYSAVLSSGVKMVISKVDAPRVQGLISEMQMFLKQATNKEREIVQVYVDKCSFFYWLVLFFCAFGSATFLISVKLASQPLPGSCAYPFSIEPLWIWTTLYLSHTFIIFQIDVMVLLDFIYTFLMWFTVAKFEMTCLEFQSATNACDIKRCVRKHQESIEYANRLCATTRFMAVHILSFTVFLITTGGFILVNNPPLLEMAKYVISYLGSGTQLYLFTWPADHLTAMSEKIRDSVYNSAWIDKPEMLKDTLFIAHRSQRPVLIGIRGIFPALSLELFGSSVSATFSYLAMLRAMVED